MHVGAWKAKATAAANKVDSSLVMHGLVVVRRPRGHGEQGSCACEVWAIPEPRRGRDACARGVGVPGLRRRRSGEKGRRRLQGYDGAAALAPTRKVGTGCPKAGYGGPSARWPDSMARRQWGAAARSPTGAARGRRARRSAESVEGRASAVPCRSRASRLSYRALIRRSRRVPGGAPPSPRIPLLGSSFSWRGAG
ncbi:hypothetical protein PVAP13_9KG255413 [Panicum virgatum]|uniref:Uncharacterized protein n=1 Tax=Panicum virgatum TaxID=38727 RepID=A0A8T0NJP4_PANVG|nr:hypothetical protein PVAP13_9KG255413 [Panicum virgatum]